MTGSLDHLDDFGRGPAEMTHAELTAEMAWVAHEAAVMVAQRWEMGSPRYLAWLERKRALLAALDRERTPAGVRR